MKSEIMRLFPWPWLSTIALMIFFTFFVVMVVLVFAKATRHLIEEGQVLPLNDGEKYGQ